MIESAKIQDMREIITKAKEDALDLVDRAYREIGGSGCFIFIGIDRNTYEVSIGYSSEHDHSEVNSKLLLFLTPADDPFNDYNHKHFSATEIIHDCAGSDLEKLGRAATKEEIEEYGIDDYAPEGVRIIKKADAYDHLQFGWIINIKRRIIQDINIMFDEWRAEQRK